MAALITINTLKDLGFNDAGIFNIPIANYDAWLQDLIDTISLRLESELGTSIYTTTEEPQKSQIKRAEVCFCSEELIARRINVKLVASNQENLDSSNEERQREKYSDEGLGLVRLLIGDSNFNFGTVKTSHFNEEAE